ncbi:MAG TPA: hypothetical protein VHM90_01600 [Phycisphaerae bacterium]|nr:hypothetical protein [Phycisphaerae bacterium]
MPATLRETPMQTGLIFTCPKNLQAQIPALLAAREIAIESRAANDDSPLPADFVCTRNRERLHVHLTARPEFPSTIEWTLTVPPVARRCDLLAELIVILKEHGAREGAADEIRCSCG